MKKLLPILLILLTFFILDEATAQCSMCRASIESNIKEGNSIGSGINAGILYLMSIPYMILMTIGFFWYKSTPAGGERIEKFTAVFKSKLSRS